MRRMPGKLQVSAICVGAERNMQLELIAERAARNQSTFRQANETIEVRAEELGIGELSIPFFCECPDPHCKAMLIGISHQEYERIRSSGTWFLVAPGHETCVIDDVTVAKVVERQGRYSVMEKVGDAGRVARSLDPRAT
jgi:hypothetical protein